MISHLLDPSMLTVSSAQSPPLPFGCLHCSWYSLVFYSRIPHGRPESNFPLLLLAEKSKGQVGIILKIMKIGILDCQVGAWRGYGGILPPVTVIIHLLFYSSGMKYTPTCPYTPTLASWILGIWILGILESGLLLPENPTR